jgi:hypothetical protein
MLEDESFLIKEGYISIEELENGSVKNREDILRIFYDIHKIELKERTFFREKLKEGVFFKILCFKEKLHVLNFTEKESVFQEKLALRSVEHPFKEAVNIGFFSKNFYITMQPKVINLFSVSEVKELTIEVDCDLYYKAPYKARTVIILPIGKRYSISYGNKKKFDFELEIV